MVGVMSGQCWWWSGLGSESRIADRWGLSPSLQGPPKGACSGQGLAFQAGLDRMTNPRTTGFAVAPQLQQVVGQGHQGELPCHFVDATEQELCLNPRTCLVSPWTGSVMTLRRAYTSRP